MQHRETGDRLFPAGTKSITHIDYSHRRVAQEPSQEDVIRGMHHHSYYWFGRSIGIFARISVLRVTRKEKGITWGSGRTRIGAAGSPDSERSGWNRVSIVPEQTSASSTRSSPRSPFLPEPKLRVRQHSVHCRP